LTFKKIAAKSNKLEIIFSIEDFTLIPKTKKIILIRSKNNMIFFL